MPYTFRQKIIYNYLRILLIYAICGAFICTILGGSVIGLYNIATNVIKISMFPGISYPIIGGILEKSWKILTFIKYLTENPYI